MDLPPNIAAAIACIPLVGGIIFYILEKRNSFVRFYAMQSIIFGGIWILFDIVSRIVLMIFSSVPAVGGFFAVLWGLIAMLVHLASVAKAAVAAIAAFAGESVDDLASRLRASVLDLQPTARRRTIRLVDPDDPPGD